ncbi:MAG: ABC transporter permease [Lautropia sp.]
MKAVAQHLVAPLLILIAWQALCTTAIVNTQFLPSPAQIASAFWELSHDPTTWRSLWVTTLRALAGLALGVLAGVPLGVGMATSRLVDHLAGPLVAMTYSLPKVAVFPLFVLWLGVGHATAILSVFLACLLPIIVHTFQGVREVPRVLLWSSRAMGDSALRRLLKVQLPGSAVQICAGVRVALGFAWVVAISTEMIAAKEGIGKSVFVYGESGAYAFMFAGIFAILFVAFAIDRAWLWAAHRWLAWSEAREER